TLGGADLVNFGNSKGLEVIPNEHLQVTVGVPPYLHHHQPGIEDGFGDFSLLAKYRFLSAKEGSGNYLSAIIVNRRFLDFAEGEQHHPRRRRESSVRSSARSVTV